LNAKNILVTIDWFLPGTKAGGPVRSIANLVEQLKEFNFYIITSNKDYCSEKSYDDIVSDQWIERSKNVKVYYFSEEQLNKENLESVIQCVDSKTIYINGIYSKFFSRIPIEIAKRYKLKTIIATRGMLSPHALNIKRLKKKAFLKVQNARKQYDNVHFHVTNEQERNDLKNTIRKYDQISVIPNLPKTLNESGCKLIEKKKGKLKLISLGRIAKEKGTVVSLRSLNQVKGHVQLDLFGTIYDQDYWKKCKSIIKGLPESVSVNYCGELDAEKVHNKLQEYHFLLLPSKGENYGHSIVESFISGRSVIISKNTPWNDLENDKSGFDINESDLPSAIQKAVNMDQTEFNQWSKSAHKKGTQISDDSTVIEKYRELFLSRNHITP
jgi:glycosyltransferase involved in cell wall biosynthesis